MTNVYRATFYRLVFSLAAAYNIGFGVWVFIYPPALFICFEIPPPNYPSLWQCLGMVLGLYGILYGYAAWKLERARPIILVGLLGKILGPIGWFMTTSSGEWPWRSFPLIVFNDFVWWLPFALFLVDDMRIGERLRRMAPWACALTNAGAAIAMLLLLQGGTDATWSNARRIAYIAQHAVLWRIGWAIWMLAALSLVGFFAWWAASIPSRRLGMAAWVIAILGLVCDWLAESLFIGWLPYRLESLAPIGTLLTGAAANALYTIAGVLLTFGTPSLRGILHVGAWVIWLSGVALTIATLVGNVPVMIVSTAALMSLLSPWVAIFGWKLTRG